MTELEAKLKAWVDAGIITAEQAAAIRSSEASREPGEGRASRAAQALGYLGGSLAMIAAGVTVARFWDSLEVWSKLTLAALATATLTAAGVWTRSAAEPAISRLTNFLWFLSGGGVAFFTVLYFLEVVDAATESTVLAAGLASAVFTLALWSLRPSALQQIALFGSLIAVLLGGLLQLERPPHEFFGFAVWGLGAAWAMSSWGGLVRPRGAGYALASLALLGGAQGFAIEPMRSWGLALGLVTALALLGASVPLAQGVLLGFGAAGVFVFVPQIVYTYLGGTLGASLALLLAGVLLVVLALNVGRVRAAVTSGKWTA